LGISPTIPNGVNPSRAKIPAELGIKMGGSYYIFQCKSAHFTAVRNESTSMNESCMGAAMESTRFDGIEILILHELMRLYPKPQREVFFSTHPKYATYFIVCGSGTYLEKITKSFDTGHQVEDMEGHRIDGLYVPSLRDCLTKGRPESLWHLKLHLRYHTQATFSLANCVLTHSHRMTVNKGDDSNNDNS
jgi:hypothetical protein